MKVRTCPTHRVVNLAADGRLLRPSVRLPFAFQQGDTDGVSAWEIVEVYQDHHAVLPRLVEAGERSQTRTHVAVMQDEFGSLRAGPDEPAQPHVNVAGFTIPRLVKVNRMRLLHERSQRGRRQAEVRRDVFQQVVGGRAQFTKAHESFVAPPRVRRCGGDVIPPAIRPDAGHRARTPCSRVRCIPASSGLSVPASASCRCCPSSTTGRSAPPRALRSSARPCG